jgi:acetyl-CoA C-acetyltransferase
VHALGWYATKHSIGVYASDPPERGFTRVPPALTQASVDTTPSRAVAGAFAGAATVEATSVVMERDGAPAFAVIALLTDDGRRLLATTQDESVMGSMTVEPWEGRSVRTRTDGTVNSLET